MIQKIRNLDPVYYVLYCIFIVFVKYVYFVFSDPGIRNILLQCAISEYGSIYVRAGARINSNSAGRQAT